jgi:hypothetical protein
VIVADEMVDIEFGTGAVKITPAHDHNDFECGKRHSLPFVQMINDEGDIIISDQFKVSICVCVCGGGGGGSGFVRASNCPMLGMFRP